MDSYLNLVVAAISSSGDRKGCTIQILKEKVQSQRQDFQPGLLDAAVKSGLEREILKLNKGYYYLGASAWKEEQERKKIMKLGLVEYTIVYNLYSLVPYTDKVLKLKAWAAVDNRILGEGGIDWYLRLPIILLSLVMPQSLGLTVLCHAVSIVSWFVALPLVWDHACWTALFEILFLLAAIQKKPYKFLGPGAARITLVILYLSAAFWKLTTSFQDHKVSCASVLVAELLSTLFPTSQIPEWLHIFFIKTAPLQVSLLEFLVPVMLFLKPSFGILTSLLFHETINWMPVMYAGGFSMACCSKLVVFLEPGLLSKAVATIRPTSSAVVIGLFALAVFTTTHKGKLDSIAVLYHTLATLYIHAVIMSLSKSAGDKNENVQVKAKGRCFKLFAIVLSFGYGFLGPILGLQAMSSSTMFASLDQYGAPGNHLVVPTGVLFRDQVASRLGPMSSVFGGGFYKIHSATGPVFDALFYHTDIWPTLPAQAQSRLLAANYTGVYLTFYCPRMLSEQPDSSFQAAGTHIPFPVSFVLHAYELKRTIALARQANQPFSITYSRLSPHLPAQGPIAWAKNSTTTFVSLFATTPDQSSSDALEEHCIVQDDASTSSVQQQCSPEDISNQPPPPRWLTKILMQYPTPLIREQDADGASSLIGGGQIPCLV